MKGNKQQRLEEWATKWVPRFNELSEQYNAPYYTQSPLCRVEDEVDIMFVGINPKGDNPGVSNLTPEQFLAGNVCWENRFKDKWKILNARFFMGCDKFRHAEGMDNDSRIVWTNLSPFSSPSGSKDLKPELLSEGIKSTIELITILQPKKMLFLGVEAFSKLDKYMDEQVKQHFKHMKVLDKLPLEIGRLFDRPAYGVCHPSGQWPVSNSFTSVFIFLRDLYDVYENGKPQRSLEKVREMMRSELELWKRRLCDFV